MVGDEAGNTTHSLPASNLGAGDWGEKATLDIVVNLVLIIWKLAILDESLPHGLGNGNCLPFVVSKALGVLDEGVNSLADPFFLVKPCVPSDHLEFFIFITSDFLQFVSTRLAALATGTLTRRLVGDV